MSVMGQIIHVILMPTALTLLAASHAHVLLDLLFIQRNLFYATLMISSWFV